MANKTPLWSDILDWLSAREGPEPVAHCFACKKELEIAGLEGKSREREPSRVLKCGHVVGEECIRRWIAKAEKRAGAGRDPEAKCPYCREVIY